MIASTKNKQDDVAKSSNKIESEQSDAIRSARKWQKKQPKFIVLI
jgi:hypothetical protein